MNKVGVVKGLFLFKASEVSPIRVSLDALHAVHTTMLANTSCGGGCMEVPTPLLPYKLTMVFTGCWQDA